MFFPGELRKYQSDLSTALKRGQIASPSLLYTNHNELNELTRNAKGRYTTYSMVDKKLDDATIELNRVLKEIDQELKDNRSRVKKLASSVNGVKNEVVLRELISTLLSNKINAIKSKVDIAVKADSARKSDIKLAMEFGGAGPNISNAVGDANSFINGLINNDTSTSSLYSFNNSNPIKSAPLTNTITPIKPTNNLRVDETGSPTLDMEHSKTLTEYKNENNPIKEEPKVEEVEEPVIEKEEVLVNTPSDGYIINALGESVPISYENTDGLDDYIVDPSVDQDLSRSEEFIKAEMNPNVKIFFKYHEPTDSGHLIAINEETMEELPNVTTLPLDLLYPWNINKTANVVSTMIREEYPIIYTDTPLEDNVMEELNRIKSRYIIE